MTSLVFFFSFLIPFPSSIITGGSSGTRTRNFSVKSRSLCAIELMTRVILRKLHRCESVSSYKAFPL